MDTATGKTQCGRRRTGNRIHRSVGALDAIGIVGRSEGKPSASARFAFQHELRAVVLAEQAHQRGHGFLQLRFQRPRRVDDEHAAAVQAEATLDRVPDGEGDVQPILGAQLLQA